MRRPTYIIAPNQAQNLRTKADMEALLEMVEVSVVLEAMEELVVFRAARLVEHMVAATEAAAVWEAVAAWEALSEAAAVTTVEGMAGNVRSW